MKRTSFFNLLSFLAFTKAKKIDNIKSFVINEFLSIKNRKFYRGKTPYVL